MRPPVRFAVLGTLALVGALVAARPASATPVLTIHPSAVTTLNVGDQFFVDVGITGLEPGHGLSFFDITLLVDGPAPVAVSTRDPNPGEQEAIDPAGFLPGLDPTGQAAIVLSPTAVEVINGVTDCTVPEADALCAVAVDALLFRAFFVAAATGSAQIAFGDVLLLGGTPVFEPGDPFPVAEEIQAELGAAITIDVAATTATPVPEPTTLLLVTGGIAALARRRVRKQSGAP